MAALVEDTAWVLSHFRPGPDHIEVTRTALTLCTMYIFIVEGPRPVRSLVALRRLPPAPASTLGRAVAIVLGATPDGGPAIHELCDSDEPLVAGAANAITSYLSEKQGDLEGALNAAERMLDAFERQRVPWLWMLANARISELCLQVEQGAKARRHLRAALPQAEQLGLASDVVGIRWWLVLANLQLGAVDEAEHWLDQAVLDWADGDAVARTYGLGVRAEILLARGEVEAGLTLWRHAVDQLRNADAPAGGDALGLQVWTAEAEAVTVVAHAHHGQLDLVEDLVGEMPKRLAAMLAAPLHQPFLVDQPVHGALLLALALVDLVRGERTGDGRATSSGARMVALAQRLRFLRAFQPTMSSARARRAAEQADGPAYHDALSSYAGLGREELRAAAVAALRERALR
jgi:tetratricopeptide (TPR) repeat protein